MIPSHGGFSSSCYVHFASEDAMLGEPGPVGAQALWLYVSAAGGRAFESSSGVLVLACVHAFRGQAAGSRSIMIIRWNLSATHGRVVPYAMITATVGEVKEPLLRIMSLPKLPLLT